MKPTCTKNKCLSAHDKEIINWIFEREYQQMKEKALKALIEEISV